MSADNSMHLRITSTNAPTSIEPVDPVEAEQRFADACWDQWPTVGAERPAVAVELVFDTGTTTVPLRRSWMWASRQLTFVWDGDTHVGVSRADPSVDDTLAPDDPFPLEGPAAQELDGFVALCRGWEQAHPDWVDALLGRQHLMPRAARCDRYDPQRDLAAGIPAGHATSFRDGSREAAMVLEELATLLRTAPINVIASNRAWTLAANELLLGLACRAETLRSTAYTRRYSS